MKVGYIGKESAGKSLFLAEKIHKIIKRNSRWLKKREKLGLPKIQRTIATDTPLHPDFIADIELLGSKYLFFRDLSEILALSEADIFINEINKFFPQNGSQPLDRTSAEWLSQGAKQGVDIYFASQDFSQCHKQFRFLVNEVYFLRKIIGSQRPKKSAPPVKRIWGIIMYNELDPDSFRGETFAMEQKNIFPHFFWIDAWTCSLYDTSFVVTGGAPPPARWVEQEQLYMTPIGEIIEKKKKWIRKN